MISESSKITNNGQVTIPKNIRKLLNTNHITFEVKDDGTIILIPIRNVAGALSQYAKKNDENFNTIRENVWSKETSYRIVQNKKDQ